MPQAVAAVENPLARLGIEHGHTAVVGLQWGDEGKGKVVDLLASIDAASGGFHVVARYNGGANAGHSLQVGDQRYALHLIPAGILDGGKINVLGNGVVIDPAQLVKEITQLRDRGIAIGENLRVSDRAHVVLPYHKAQDALLEATHKRSPTAEPIGTTGRGIGPCYADKALRTLAVRMVDLLDADRLAPKVRRIVAVKNVALDALANHYSLDFDELDAEQILDDLLEQARVLRPHICDTAALLHEASERGERLLFEGANATLLDIDHGTYPFVTSSNCSSLGVHTGTGMPGHLVPNVLGIVKAYQTRVGGGPMVTELHDATGDAIREKGKEFGTTTGRPRRCGWLDLVALKYTARISGATGLAITLLDVLAGLDELKICTAYKLPDGKTLDTVPADSDLLEKAKPVYETLQGFGDIETATSIEELPEPAVAYLRSIEEAVGVPVVMVSVGPEREQTLMRSI